MKHYKACQSNPCMNSIVCLNDDDGVYTCICLPDWYGKNCQYHRSKILMRYEIIEKIRVLQKKIFSNKLQTCETF